MKQYSTTSRIMRKQIPIAEKIIELVKKGYSFDGLVLIYLPEHTDKSGIATLEIKSMQDLKKNYRWSGSFDATLRMPLSQRDEIFTILYELDKKSYPGMLGLKTEHLKLVDIDSTYYWQVKVAVSNQAIQSINASNLDEILKLKMIGEFKKAMKL